MESTQASQNSVYVLIYISIYVILLSTAIHECVAFSGLETSMNEVPFRFLVKQLLVEKNRIIFTGMYVYVQ